MPQTEKTRRAMLEEFVAANPADAFARFGLAMECAGAGDDEAAIGHYRELLSSHPGYVTGYFQFGRLLARLGRDEEARKILASGMEAAAKAGDTHARDEMEAFLQDIG